MLSKLHGCNYIQNIFYMKIKLIFSFVKNFYLKIYLRMSE